MRGISLAELMLIVAVIVVVCISVFPFFSDSRWIHDLEHPERLERWNQLHNTGTKNEDCEKQKRLLKQEC